MINLKSTICIPIKKYEFKIEIFELVFQTLIFLSFPQKSDSKEHLGRPLDSCQTG